MSGSTTHPVLIIVENNNKNTRVEPVQVFSIAALNKCYLIFINGFENVSVNSVVLEKSSNIIRNHYVKSIRIRSYPGPNSGKYGPE